MMYNPQLDTFICVVESGSFSKAAEKLYISPTAVIKQINSLEASLDLKLFSRTHRGLVVTDAGQSIYNDAKYIVGLLQRFDKTCKGSNGCFRQCDTCRSLSDDSSGCLCRALAKDTKNISGYEIPAYYI